MGILSKFQKLVKYRKDVATYLDFKSDNDNPYWGSVSDNEIEVLKSLTLEANKYRGPIVEVGALFGLTSQLIASHKDTDKKFYVIENYNWNPFGLNEAEHRMFLRRNLYDCTRNRNTDLIEMDNKRFYNSYQGESPSMIFIDADHSYEGVSKDIEWAIKQEINIISGHDFNPQHEGVVKAVKEHFDDSLEVKESVWIYKN